MTTKQKENSDIKKLLPRLKSKYIEEIVPAMMTEFKFDNKLRVPRVTKVVVNVGLGEALVSSNVVQTVSRDLQLITGQKPIERKAKKSIANFKLREGQIIGLSVTLRSNNMWFFLDKLFNVSLPRVRDFRGVSSKSFDGNGNYSLGLQEQVIFPEIDYNEIDKACLDMCAAPGGKSFQAIAANAKVFSNDKNKKRLKILRNNLVRLNFDAKILNMDATNLNINEKFDLVIIDAPCSGIGTIRRNPEILFKSEKPNIGKLNKIQKKLLSESKKHLNRDGYILYMVCSFLYSETISQINSFLVENENFNLIKLTTPKMLIDHFNIDDYFLTLPSNYKGYNFDGYFAALIASKK